MQYLLAIYEDEAQSATMNDEERQALLGAYFAYTNALKEAGALIAGDALQSVTTATTVRIRDDKRTTTDGPFAETAEQLGGYYLIDVPDLDAALEWASKIPAAKTGSIEVRPIMTFD